MNVFSIVWRRFTNVFLLSLLLPLGVARSQPTNNLGLKGLVFEAEDWSEPREAWLTNTVTANKWRLWTTEGPGKRSRDASLASPRIERDRNSPEEGAPPLHTRITSIPTDVYRAWLGRTPRPLAYSLDGGKTWLKSETGETDLGIHDIRDGVFELWVDDRFANPANIGSAYYDYIRLEKFVPPTLTELQAFTLPNGDTQISWLSSEPASPAIVECAGETVAEPDANLRNHRVVLSNLPARECEAKVRFSNFVAATLRFTPGKIPRPEHGQNVSVDLTVAEPTATGRRAWPVTSGVPFAPGVLASARSVGLSDAAGNSIPAQCEPVAWWPDGSVKWLWVSFLADTTPNQPRVYQLRTASNTPPRLAGGVEVVETAGGWLVGNGEIQFHIAKTNFALFEGLTSRGSPVVGSAIGGNGRIVAADGKIYSLGTPDVVVEERGPVRGVVRVEGAFSNGDEHLCRWRARYEWYAGQPWVRLSWTIGNDATNTTFTELQSADVRVPFAAQGAWRGALADGPAVAIAEEQNTWLLQDKDDRFTLALNGQQTSGQTALGCAFAADTKRRLGVFVRDFQQLYPKGFAIKPDGLQVRILPPLPADEYAAESRNIEDLIRLYYNYRDGRYLVKRGLEFTTDLFVRVDAASAAPAPAVAAAWFQQPLFAVAPPAHYCASGVFGPMEPRQAGLFDAYERQVANGLAKLEQNRRAKHEYGWMNYGDWHGERHFNWGNQEYDLMGALAEEFIRTGELDYLWRAAQATRHNTDIDTIHYAWQARMPGRVYAHSVGHVGGFFDPADERFKKLGNVFGLPDPTKPNAFVVGAIDPGGHVFEPGNFLIGLLTGERRYLETAEMVCAAQAAYLTPQFDFGIERAAGWPLRNAVAAYEATGNPYYLNAAKIYVHKVVTKQTARGDWNLPHGPPECLHTPPHPGGKAFATGVLLNALMCYDLVAPSRETKDCIVRAAHWLERDSWNHETHRFRYIDTCPTYEQGGQNDGTDFLVSSGLAYACTLDADPALKSLLLDSLSRAVKSGISVGKDFAQDINHTPHALAIMHQKLGVTELKQR